MGESGLEKRDHHHLAIVKHMAQLVKDAKEEAKMQASRIKDASLKHEAEKIIQEL